MKIIETHLKQDGFRGQLFDPENGTSKAVIILMGGEGKIISAKLLAEKLSNYGIAALALYYWNGEDLPPVLSDIPLEMVESAVDFLKKYNGGFKKIGTYGISFGSVIALMSGVIFPEISCVIAVSATHIIPEGFIDKKKVSGKSFLTYKGKPFEYISLESNVPNFKRFQNAYENNSNENTYIPVEKINGRILLMAGNDESWNSKFSAEYMENRLNINQFPFPHKLCEYKGSHYIGIIPDMKKYKLLNLIKLISKEERRNKVDCENARKQSEQEIINWIKAW